MIAKDVVEKKNLNMDKLHFSPTRVCRCDLHGHLEGLYMEKIGIRVQE